MKKNVIVAMSDSNYFELLIELIDSIKSFEESKDIAICILDAGLDKNQISQLEGKVDSIRKAEWDIEVSSFKVRGKEWLKSQVSRAFLPKYFPGYNKYLWIDADAWVNKWEAIDLYFKASDKNRLAISTSADRAYGRVLRAEWLFGGWAKIKSQNYKHAKSSGFSEDDARKVALMPHLNIGVFCLNENAPHWKIWQKNLKKALSSGKIFGSEQIAMNISVYVDNVEIDILPAYCNWTLIDKLKFDVKKQSFVEPYTPNHEIGIVHLAGKNNDDSRKNKNFLRNVETLDGEIIKKSVRFGQ
tara:strand:- start:522 stop:1421 length:900 start_codon:yes stop_codon:yes gene_type:complete